MNATTQGRRQERDINITIADCLAMAMPRSVLLSVQAEQLGCIVDSNVVPDIIVREGTKYPVIIETEVAPARTVIKDAYSRLGVQVFGTAKTITECIAVTIDGDARTDSDDVLKQRLMNGEKLLGIQIVRYGAPVYPSKPAASSIYDLAAHVEFSQAPQAAIDEASKKIANSISNAGAQLLGFVRTSPNAKHLIQGMRERTGCVHEHEKPEEFRNPKKLKKCNSGKCDCDLSSMRSACAVWLIAINLQNNLAQHSGTLQKKNLQSTASMQQRSVSGSIAGPEILKQWQKIAKVDYEAVMEIAIETLKPVNSVMAMDWVLDALHDVSTQVSSMSIQHAYNLYGEIWQRLVPDREERAAHYTLPPIAVLLITVAAARFRHLTAQQLLEGVIMDAASGTGTLLGVAERAWRSLYYRAGGNDTGLHKYRMENGLYALDVNSIAGALTAKRLTDLDVASEYGRTHIAVTDDPAGSLVLEDPRVTSVASILGLKHVAAGSGVSKTRNFHVPHNSVRWTPMNAPYTKPSTSRGMATKGLDSIRTASRKAGWRMCNGNAGIATDFANLCGIRLMVGGVYSHVLPLTAARGAAWKEWRIGMEKDFSDIVVIANVPKSGLESMSADTTMNEMLVIATKRGGAPKNKWKPTAITYFNLDRAPTTQAEGYIIGNEVVAAERSVQNTGRISGGGYRTIQQTEPGAPWWALANGSNDFMDVVSAMLEGRAFDVQSGTDIGQFDVPMAKTGDLATTGPGHLNTIGCLEDGSGRGAYEWRHLSEFNQAPVQQAMWTADSAGRTSIDTEPTHGAAKVLDQELAVRMNAKRSHWFISRDMGWAAQVSAFAHTKRICHGGVAWTAMLDMDDDIAMAMTLYHNSIFGAITRAGYGTTAQPGRARVHIKAIGDLPVPAFHANAQAAQNARSIAAARFASLSHLELQPFVYCFRDAKRHQIDNAVAEMLGLDPGDPDVQQMMADWRVLFASEPNINGRNKEVLKALDDWENPTPKSGRLL